MELDQLLFKKVSNFISRVRNRPSEEELKRTVTLESCRGTLTLLAQALTGRAIKIVTAEREGGWKDDCFFLPAQFSMLPTKTHNEQLYWFRVFYLSTLINHHKHLPAPEESVPISANSALNREILSLLFDEFPVWQTNYTKLKQSLLDFYQKKETRDDYSWLFGKWMLSSRDRLHGNTDTDAVSQKGLPNPKTEIQAKPVDEVNSIQVDKKKQQDYTLMHNFEKIETAEEFNGTWRDFDGDDQLEEHQEALQQITMRHTVRVDDETHSVYQSEFIGNAVVPDSDAVNTTPDARCYHYDEWDHRKLTYRKNHCTVYASKARQTDSAYVQKTLGNNGMILRSLSKEFANFFNKLIEVKRLNQGEILDMDILTDVLTDIRAQKAPTDKVYTSRRKRDRDLAILFLLDLSLSSDGYTGGNRIIDVEKQIAILMGELLSSYHIPFQIDGFSSKTRNYCSYSTFKSFDDSWSTQKTTIGGIAPEGYTRIGPALRHAKTLMEQQDARKKWIVVLSDGKPNDYDKYEGTYGISDIKQALRELEKNHIHTHTFAIEEKAKYYLPQIFGKDSYNVLSNPREMLISMTHFCQRVITT